MPSCQWIRICIFARVHTNILMHSERSTSTLVVWWYGANLRRNITLHEPRVRPSRSNLLFVSYTPLHGICQPFYSHFFLLYWRKKCQKRSAMSVATDFMPVSPAATPEPDLEQLIQSAADELQRRGITIVALNEARLSGNEPLSNASTQSRPMSAHWLRAMKLAQARVDPTVDFHPVKSTETTTPASTDACPYAVVLGHLPTDSTAPSASESVHTVTVETSAGPVEVTPLVTPDQFPNLTRRQRTVRRVKGW